jgi:hypothetical protein
MGNIAWLVKAHHVKAVPGRKTNRVDTQWQATLCRAGLLRASFIPPLSMRQLRLVARQRQKPVGMCSAEKNRLNKVLVDAGIRNNLVVTDTHGQSVRALAKALTSSAASWRCTVPLRAAHRPEAHLRSSRPRAEAT